jgi:hypothetical protein
MQRSWVTFLSTAITCLTPGVALGQGATKPSQAPPISVGEHYFGNTNHATNNGNYAYDLWGAARAADGRFHHRGLVGLDYRPHRRVPSHRRR